jgi:fumarate reductase subunit C
MSEKPAYSEYHPRWYRRPMSTWWWLERLSYLLFILREVSSVFVAWSVVYLLLVVAAVSQDRPFPELARNGFIVVLNIVSLVFVCFHAITWFNLAPKALVVRLRGKRIPGTWIAASNYVAWVLVSAVVAWVVLGG